MFQCNSRILVPSVYCWVGWGGGGDRKERRAYKISTEPWEMKSGAVVDDRVTPQAVAIQQCPEHLV